jgi:hypothetical protein
VQVRHHSERAANIDRTDQEEAGMLKEIVYSGPPLDVLHAEYAKKGQIDESAPVKAFQSITLNAPVLKVWGMLINLPDWPSIDPSFQDVRLSSLSEDTVFSFKLRNFPIKAKIAVVQPGRSLVWTGVSLWFKAVDKYVLEPMEDGNTRLYLAESFSGFLASLFMSSERLMAQHGKWLAAFKLAVEKKQ